MSAQTANSQFSFHLPSLSYIDAKWEEPSLRESVTSPATVRKSGFVTWLSGQISNFVAWRRDGQAIAELATMSDHELMDIGLNRGDLSRIFQPAFSEDLRQRGVRI
jgi:uncharacterized protein YjiS (DUF1127 family)